MLFLVFRPIEDVVLKKLLLKRIDNNLPQSSMVYHGDVIKFIITVKMKLHFSI